MFNIQIKLNFHKKWLRFFLYAFFPLLYFLIPGYRWVLDDLLIAQVKYMYLHPKDSEQQKKLSKYGKEKYALCFYLNQLPEQAEIIYPPDSLLDRKYIRICRDFSWVSSQIYPRTLIRQAMDAKQSHVYQILYGNVQDRDTFIIIPGP